MGGEGEIVCTVKKQFCVVHISMFFGHTKNFLNTNLLVVQNKKHFPK